MKVGEGGAEGGGGGRDGSGNRSGEGEEGRGGGRGGGGSGVDEEGMEGWARRECGWTRRWRRRTVMERGK